MTDAATAFAAAMAALGPFEDRPRLGVALSGGADSLALLDLADHWAAERGGSVLAMSVDHAIRPAAAREVELLGAWAVHRGIGFVAARLPLSADAGAGHALLRERRAAALSALCETHRVLHLLLGHHADDSFETIVMRARRGSGMAGLAGIAAVGERARHRLLRPLLGCSKQVLRDHLVRQGLLWIDDPSNSDDAYERARVRAALEPPAVPLRPAAARRSLEVEGASFIARFVVRTPARGLAVDRAALEALPMSLRCRVLQDLINAIAGGACRGHGRAIARLAADLPPDGQRRTLGNVLIRGRSRTFEFGHEIRQARRHGVQPGKCAPEAVSGDACALERVRAPAGPLPSRDDRGTVATMPGRRPRHPCAAAAFEGEIVV